MCAHDPHHHLPLVLQRTLIALFKYPPVFDIIKGGGYYDDKYSIRPTAIRTVGS